MYCLAIDKPTNYSIIWIQVFCLLVKFASWKSRAIRLKDQHTANFPRVSIRK